MIYHYIYVIAFIVDFPMLYIYIYIYELEIDLMLITNDLCLIFNLDPTIIYLHAHLLFLGLFFTGQAC